ncbi:MAG: DUF4826 domain-containing protein [Gammaproteobacteria bacterium]|nr:MAG: DUF4826 domain-containing protein [Gammaproteobacteria bacterium]
MSDNEQLTEEQAQAWVREQYQVATKYLANKGLVTDSVMVEDSRYIAPLLSVWKLKLLDNSWHWVICGDLPTDHVSIEAANSAKEVLKHFSLKWQLQAENILKHQPSEEQAQYANILVGRAESLYKLSEDEKLW